jgi:hypothetical protein
VANRPEYVTIPGISDSSERFGWPTITLCIVGSISLSILCHLLEEQRRVMPFGSGSDHPSSRQHSSRSRGTSFLSVIGLPELAVDSADNYVRVAAMLAHDMDRLRELRNALRQRMQNSPLMNPARFARGVERAYRDMWSGWCGRVDIET